MEPAARIKFGLHCASQYKWMSNFSPHPIVINGKHFDTAEHYFQYTKFCNTDPNFAEKIRTTADPSKAKKLGRSRAHPIDPEWEKNKYNIMKDVLLHKITQNNLTHKLLDTGDCELIADLSTDYEWGCGIDGTGKNLLGIALMEIRAELNAVHPDTH